MAQPDEHTGQVVPFPTRSADVEPAPEVLDAELVDEQSERRPARWVPSTIVRVAQYEPTRRTVRTVVATSLTIGHGLESWARKYRDSRSMNVYGRGIRAAEANGDLQAMAEWVDRRESALDRRHKRLMDLPKLAGGLARVLVGCAAVFVVLMLVAALVVQLTGVGSFLGFLGGVLDLIRFAVTVVTVAWLPLLIASPLFVGFLAWREGRKHAPATQWATGFVDGDEGRDIVPSDGAILEALRHLGISKLDDAFKRGWGSVGHPARVFEQGTARDGNGWRTQIRLPQGVTVEMINKRKAILAHNLVRMPVEVWPTEPKDKPGVLDLWVAESGSLTGPPPAWPLLAKLDTVTTDYFKGVPAGVNIRGDNVNGVLFESNYAAAGLMGSGKSSLVITLLLGALLDPLVEADVFVCAQNADYEPMRPRLRSLVTGAGPSTVEACMAVLRELYSDLERRGQALLEHDSRAVTRKLAEADERLRPRILVVDECQALFMDETYGEEAANLVQLVISAARKYAVTLMFLTPEPSTASLPRKVITITNRKAAFALGDQQSNDAILGTGSYRAGISAVSLEPKTDESDGDVGTAMVRGFMAKPGLLRSYFVNQADAHRVTVRALQIREQAGITGRNRAAIEAEQRDLLEDVAEALSGERVNAADVPALLRDLAPNWAPYRTLNGKALVAQLGKLGVKVPSTGNRYPVDPAAVRRALAEQATADLDDE